MRNDIVFTKEINKALRTVLLEYKGQRMFILLDENTKKYCYPLIKEAFDIEPSIIFIPSGESYKTIETVSYIWNKLSDFRADRDSVLINLGGGVITDIGGFSAATFKRGIRFINVPTTLLSIVDASIGGKNGVNFGGYKNQIGTFSLPSKLIIFTGFLHTLPLREFTSGYAEMVKHALLSSEKSWQILRVINPESPNYDALDKIIFESIKIKQGIVEQDPNETGIREALNFGHTIGHAMESFFNNKGKIILHGEAVAIGMIAELFLSNKKLMFDFEKLFEITEYLATYFQSFEIDYAGYKDIYEIMKHDKKNKAGKIRFTLLEKIGKFKINQVCDKEEIFQAINFYFQVKK